MSLIEDINTLSDQQIEDVEKLTVRWLFQAVRDFGMEAFEVFRLSPDDVKDVAEDVTREILDRLPGYNVPQRIYGTVDYKKARYIILPERMVRQALFVDSKAEKESGNATLQMSQTSLRIRQCRSGQQVDQPGLLPKVSIYGGKQYLTTTAFLHFTYEDVGKEHRLSCCTICGLPNGRLQDRYNPSAKDTIWMAGRNAPSLGEDFRARISYKRLKAKAAWRVQRICYSADQGCSGEWED